MTDLVERVALLEKAFNAYREAAPYDVLPSAFGVEAAIAIVLEEAARVAESYEPRCDTCPRGVAAAIRAMIPSGNDPAQDDTGSAE